VKLCRVDTDRYKSDKPDVCPLQLGRYKPVIDNSRLIQMSTVLSQEAPPSSLRSVPVAVWGVVGALALASAGLAGALVMRSVDSDKVAAQAEPSSSVTAQQAPTATAGTSQAALQAQPAQLAAAPQAAPKPVHKPVQKPAQPVQSAPQVVAQGQPQSSPPTHLETTRAAVCGNCGTVEAVHAIQQKGEGSGLGAVAGGVLGGVLGNQVGGGTGKAAMTVLGAVGGGLAGNEAEKRYKATTVYDVQVRMEDGSVRSFRRNDAVAVGTRVTVDGSTMRVGSGAASSAEPRTLRTSTGA
jgi:outer membrane lipoprotein SlyB